MQVHHTWYLLCPIYIMGLLYMPTPHSSPSCVLRPLVVHLNSYFPKIAHQKQIFQVDHMLTAYL